jgi:predicted transposase YbfD/YdcC
MSLDSLFASIPDHRGLQGKDYKLSSIIALIIISMLSGRKGLMAAYRLGRSLSMEQKRLLGFPALGNTPCHATLTETVRYLDPNALSDCLKQLSLKNNKEEKLLIHIDGKTLRGTTDGEQKAVHCLSAFCDYFGGVVGQAASRGSGHEIEDAFAVLNCLDLTNTVVTADAKFCQKAIVKQIKDGGGDCILQVKNNQKILKKQIEADFKNPLFSPEDLDKSNRKSARTD